MATPEYKALQEMFGKKKFKQPKPSWVRSKHEIGGDFFKAYDEFMFALQWLRDMDDAPEDLLAACEEIAPKLKAVSWDYFKKDEVDLDP